MNDNVFFGLNDTIKCSFMFVSAFSQTDHTMNAKLIIYLFNIHLYI